MAYISGTTRVGRSQGASIFWGLVSLFFATAACYFYWKDYETQPEINKLRDQVLALQDERESLNSEKDKLQAGIAEAAKQLETRQEFLQEKETELAEEETRIEALGSKTDSQTQTSQSQSATIKKFDDTVRKLAKSDDTDVVVREGRPVLRMPSSVFFAPGDSTLKLDGKAVLAQIARSLDGEMDNFEFRIETFTDPDGEALAPAPDAATPPAAGAKPDTADKVPAPARVGSWDLTGARAAALARYFRDQSNLPFQNIVVTARGDSSPIVTGGKEGHARNRRIEFTVLPLPGPFHPAAPAPAAASAAAAPTPAAAPASLEPPPDSPTNGSGH